MARERFYFYEKWWRVLKNLPEQSALATYKAACSFVFEERDITEELDTEARVAFMFIKQEIERDQEAYDKVVERNRVNGQNGGRPRRNKEEENPKNPMGYIETQENPEKPSKPNKSRNEKKGLDTNREDNKDIEETSLSLEEQREREIFEISLLFLRKGIKSPVSEAREYYNYYQASGWRKSNEHQTPIIDKVAYAQTWKTKNEQIISEHEGEIWSKLISSIGFKNLGLAAEFIEEYRGYFLDNNEREKVRFFFSTRNTKKKFETTYQKNELFKSRVLAHLSGYGVKEVICDIAANDPRL